MLILLCRIGDSVVLRWVGATACVVLSWICAIARDFLDGILCLDSFMLHLQVFSIYLKEEKENVSKMSSVIEHIY